MNGELAQVICLASHGSSWLARSSHLVAPALERENSTFQFVGSLRFAPPGLERAADTVADWLRQLCDRGVSRLWLVIPEAAVVAGDGVAEDEHMLAGFSNAGRWGLLATGGQRLEAWRASWAVGDRDAPGRRIWSVTYQGAYVEHATAQRPGLRDAGEHLAEALRSARDFAIRQDLNPWPAWFDRALASGDDIPYHPDMLPAAYTSHARHLAAMAAHAWVFGGMGSWNDIAFGDPAIEPEYREVSRHLYAAVLLALLASVNDDMA